mgnify:FL=1
MPDSTSASPKDKAKEEMIVENSLPEEEGKTAEQILEEIYYAPDPEVQLRSRRKQQSTLDTFYLLHTELARLKSDIERIRNYPLAKIYKKLKELLGTGSAFVLSSLSRKFDKEIPQLKTRDETLVFIVDLLDHFSTRFAKEITRLEHNRK